MVFAFALTFPGPWDVSTRNVNSVMITWNGIERINKEVPNTWKNFFMGYKLLN
jgi:hypothetical protein